jgi:hypothetical protein
MARPTVSRLLEVIVSGHKHHKKDGTRKEKQTRARKHDFEQPIVRAVAPQSARDTSNFTDGEIAGPDWKRKLRERERGSERT